MSKSKSNRSDVWGSGDVWRERRPVRARSGAASKQRSSGRCEIGEQGTAKSRNLWSISEVGGSCENARLNVDPEKSRCFAEGFAAFLPKASDPPVAKCTI